jgi:hypothetical protein
MTEYTAGQIENIVAYSKARKAYRRAVAKVVRLEIHRKTYGDQFSGAETRARLFIARAEEKRAWSWMLVALGAHENPEQVLKESGHGPVKVDRTTARPPGKMLPTRKMT